MNKQLIRKCPVCEHTTGEVLYHTRFILMEGNPLATECDVVSCARCCFAFADTPSTQEDYDTYYSAYSKYEDAASSTSSGVSPADASRIRQQADHIAAFLPDTKTRIADIGCANGGLLSVLKTMGYNDLTGIDPSPVCVRNIRAQGIEGFTGIFSSLPAMEKPFDMILLTGVLEHVLDVGKAVDALGALLAPAGRIYIAVPDASRYPDFLYAPFQDFSTEHINHFTDISLTNLMHRKGYKAVSAGQFSITTPPESVIPLAFGVFRRASASTDITPDDHLKRQLILYVEASTKFMDRLSQQLISIFERYPEIILWGTGQLAFKLLALPAVDPSRIAAFVDSNPIHQGLTLMGKPILSPKQVGGMMHPILIMTTLHQSDISEGIRNKLGLKNEIITLS